MGISKLRRVLFVLGTLTPVLLPVTGILEPLFAGDEFKINSYTLDDQFRADVGAADDGRFVVVWSSLGQDGDNYGVFARRFGAGGLPLGPELQVDTVSAGFQGRPKVSVNGAGEFVVAWQRDGEVQARQFSADGVPFDGPQQVHSPVNQQGWPEVQIGEDGGFVVFWNEYPSLLGKRFGSDGRATGAPFEIRAGGSPQPEFVTYFRDIEAQPRPGGGFVVAWSRFSSYVPSSEFTTSVVEMAVHDASDVQLDSFQISPSIETYEQNPALAVVDSEFVVVWSSYSFRQYNGRLEGRSFAADGSPSGGRFELTEYDMALERGAAMVPQDGEFLLFWSQDTQDLLARRFATDGTPVGAVETFSTVPGSSNRRPAAVGSGDDLIVVWDASDQDGDGQAVVGRIPSVLFVDGFETGDTTKWSASSVD